MKINSKINEKAVLTYGITVQSVVCMEELAELQKEISKFIRGQGNWLSLREEIADVRICIDQLKMMYNISDEELEKEIRAKQYRTAKRMEGVRYGHLETNSNK